VLAFSNVLVCRGMANVRTTMRLEVSEELSELTCLMLEGPVCLELEGESVGVCVPQVE